MQLTIITETFDRGTTGSPGPTAAAVLARDERKQINMFEGGFYFANTPGDVADCRALVRCIELASQLGAQELQLLHRSKAVVELVTGERTPSDAGIETLIDEAQMKLLQFDSWLIREAAKTDLPNGGELIHETITAERDIVHRAGAAAASAAADEKSEDAEAETAAESQSPEQSGEEGDAAENASQPAAAGDDDEPAWPSWDIQFVMEPGPACPAPAKAELRYHFGPTVPADLCMYAACDVLNEGPIDSPKRYPQESTLECRKCGVLIHLQRRDER